ncbi:phosphoribosylaminoimidazolesuccinocarboxamide synthase [Lentibacillus cibarius]|uniref:Phosphoribosylaminoimidazole-succinocarboxamide synthase n=1 Tax=Lentibacillus cibarius TaxID=2583219 RepID=A0A5S3R7V7_9BACI|nr:phosphoribosylaminoimidazolesuccinocarboxamide synthase [Lentibacillus cibarius]TMN22773.1 phosphoribosylaminoimidazolesuccinocarboxamide synthase [Lentibacillus cibarius]
MKGKLLYEGKAKRVYQADGQPGKLVLEYKNDVTAFNGEKKDMLPGKADLNNAISSHIFHELNDRGIRTHFIEKVSATEQLVHASEIIPLEVVVRNITAGSIAKRLGIQAGTPLTPPIIELFYKNDDLNDPLINDDHAMFLSDVNQPELNDIKTQALEINRQLIKLFTDVGIELVDFKLEFGRLSDGSVVLSDEISPDTCRLWDIQTRENLDKDVFRNGTGNLLEVYEKLMTRLEEAR